MRISTPVTSRATKHRVVIQWVARTRAECREGTVLAGTVAAEVATQAESRIWNATSWIAVVQAGASVRALVPTYRGVHTIVNAPRKVRAPRCTRGRNGLACKSILSESL